jgi:phosphatidylserine decarboxylase
MKNQEKIMNSTLAAYSRMPRQLYIAREGHPFIMIAFAAALLAWMSGWIVGFVALIGLTAFVAFFFRNPNRNIPTEPDVVVAPADGRIVAVDEGVEAPQTGNKSTKISIFMSVLNVHINRFPVDAKVKEIAYHPGKFLVASVDKASAHNERNAIVLEDKQGREFTMVQIAGLVARRIICYLRKGDNCERGDRFGLIRFGSRVDIYMPSEASANVRVGDRVRAGETILGRFE